MDYLPALSKMFDSDELDSKIDEKIKEFHGFITRKVAIDLIAKDAGIYKKEIKFTKIKDIDSNLVNLRAKVLSIGEIITYPSGKCARNITLEDDTGKIQLTLWENRFSFLEKILIGYEIEINGAYLRNGKLGIKYSGKLKVVQKSKFTPLEQLSKSRNENIIGFASGIEGLKLTPQGRNFSFYVSDEKNEIKAIVLDGVDRFKSLEKNDKIILENVKFRDNVIYVSGGSRVFMKKSKNSLIGVVEDISFKDGSVAAILDGNLHHFEGSNAYAFLNVTKSQNISLETLIKLKRDFYRGKKVLIKFNDDKFNIKRISIIE